MKKYMFVSGLLALMIIISSCDSKNKDNELAIVHIIGTWELQDYKVINTHKMPEENAPLVTFFFSGIKELLNHPLYGGKIIFEFKEDRTILSYMVHTLTNNKIDMDSGNEKFSLQGDSLDMGGIKFSCGLFENGNSMTLRNKYLYVKLIKW